MGTVVCQAYSSPTGVPPWIERCMDTVRGWAERSGFAYERSDDGLFDRVPPWFRERVGGEPVRMSDLARLLLARSLLARYERAVWVDADVVVFDPERFVLDAPDGYALCREAWLSLTPEGRVQSRRASTTRSPSTRAATPSSTSTCTPASRSPGAPWAPSRRSRSARGFSRS